MHTIIWASALSLFKAIYFDLIFVFWFGFKSAASTRSTRVFHSLRPRKSTTVHGACKSTNEFATGLVFSQQKMASRPHDFSSSARSNGNERANKTGARGVWTTGRMSNMDVLFRSVLFCCSCFCCCHFSCRSSRASSRAQRYCLPKMVVGKGYILSLV